MTKSLLLSFAFIMGAFFDVSGQTVEELDAFHKQKFLWMEQTEIDSLDQYLHPSLVYVHSNAWHEDKQEVLENLQNGKLSYQKVTIEQSFGRIEGNTGIVNGKGKFEVALNGDPLTIYLDYTEVYVWIDNKWKLLSRHACRYEP